MNIHQTICARQEMRSDNIDLSRFIGMGSDVLKTVTESFWILSKRKYENRYMSQKDWTENRKWKFFHFNMN
jgi:hypothetical protein